MPQNDLDIANQTFPAFRADLNAALQAQAQQQSGSSAPATTYPYMLWADTTNSLLKIRNAANNAWVTVGRLDANGWSVRTNSGNPQGTLPVDFVGQLCVDTTNNLLYIGTTANATAANAVWDVSPTFGAATLFNNPKNLFPTYVNASQVSFAKGSILSSDGKKLITFSGATTVDLTVSGAGGLDTGSEASNTIYFAWAMGKADGTSTIMFSTSNSSPTMGAYTFKALIPGFFIRNNASSNIIPFAITAGWGLGMTRYQFTIPTTLLFPSTSVGATNVLNGGTSTSWSTIALTSYMPSTAIVAILGWQPASGSDVIQLRTNSTLANTTEVQDASFPIEMYAPSQAIDYQRVNGSGTQYIDLMGCWILGV